MTPEQPAAPFTPEQMATEQAAWDFYIERRKAMVDGDINANHA